MPDPLMTIDADPSAVDAAFDRLYTSLQSTSNEACHVSAESIVREAKSRLERQLSGTSTGETVAGIQTRPAYDGNGWVVLADNERMPNLPLWLEKGTKPGKRHNYARTPAFKFFYISIELEVGPHERRIHDAMQESAQMSGLGG